MSEGTKIGGFKEDNEFNTAVRTQDEEEQDLTATKYGQMSEFEKSLYSETKEDPSRSARSDNKEDVSHKDAQEEDVSKLEKQEDPETSKEDQVALKSFEHEVENSLVDIQEGDLIKGVIRSIEKSGILVDISYKSDGYLSNLEVQDEKNKEYKPGDEILVLVEKLESKEGYAILSRKKAIIEEAWNEIINCSKNKETVSVKVDSKVQGGLVVSF